MTVRFRNKETIYNHVIRYSFTNKTAWVFFPDLICWIKNSKFYFYKYFAHIFKSKTIFVNVRTERPPLWFDSLIKNDNSENFIFRLLTCKHFSKPFNIYFINSTFVHFKMQISMHGSNIHVNIFNFFDTFAHSREKSLN